MAKQTFQDIIKSKTKVVDTSGIDMSFRRGFDQFDSNDNSGNRSRYIVWVIAIGSAIALFFILSHFFARATVTVTPKSASVPLDDLSFTAIKTGNADNLGFEVMAISGKETKDVSVTEQKDVSANASGTIVIFNAFSATPQPLVVGTRFETSNGKIFKITTPVVVPGEKIVAGKTTPGSIEANVVASAPGADYNIPLSDFTIPGFKGNPKYTKIYARSKAPFTGGLIGKVGIVSETDANQIRVDLATTLQNKLIAQTQAQLPDGYMFFNGTVFWSADAVHGPVYGTDKNVVVTETGTLTTLIFKRTDITRKIAKSGIRDYDNLPVTVTNLDTLALTLRDHDMLVPGDLKNISFAFKGIANVVWNVDQKTLISDLAGIKKKDFDSVLEKYPNIKKASVIVRPFWDRSLPSSVGKIRVVLGTE